MQLMFTFITLQYVNMYIKLGKKVKILTQDYKDFLFKFNLLIGDLYLTVFPLIKFDLEIIFDT